MKFSIFLLVTAFSGIAYSAVGDSCSGTEGSGTCKKTSSCASSNGFYINNKCPNDPENVKCCIQDKCYNDKGNCLNTSQSCSGGSFKAGYCPGDSSIKCCVPDSGSSDPKPPSGGGKGILDAAVTQKGVPYSWAGGGCHGKSLGKDQGAHTVGFDCSGLTQYAVCQFTNGKTVIPRTTRTQYAKGKRIPWADRKVGDLIYWATGGDCSCSGGECPAMHHTAIYAGNGKMFEAKKTGTKLNYDDVWDGGERCDYVIRWW